MNVGLICSGFRLPHMRKSRLRLPTTCSDSLEVSRAGTPGATDRYVSLSRLPSAFGLSPLLSGWARIRPVRSRDGYQASLRLLRVESSVRPRVSRRRRDLGPRIGAQQGDAG